MQAPPGPLEPALRPHFSSRKVPGMVDARSFFRTCFKAGCNRTSPRRVQRVLIALSLLSGVVLLAGLRGRVLHSSAAELSADAAESGPYAARHAPSVASAGKFECSQKRFLGDAYGGWTICMPEESLHGAVVYTIGVGRNIEWDKEMIRTFGTVHHGWDPTPTAADFFSKRGPPPGFTFHKYGLGERDGQVTVKLPEGNHDSYTIMGYGRKAQRGRVTKIEVRTVKSMLRMLGHSRIAILKIDIEGAEFGVIREWARSSYRPPVDQILIEFHERYFDAGKRRLMVPQAIQDMRKIGFGVFHRAKLVR